MDEKNKILGRFFLGLLVQPLKCETLQPLGRYLELSRYLPPLPLLRFLDLETLGCWLLAHVPIVWEPLLTPWEPQTGIPLLILICIMSIK